MRRRGRGPGRRGLGGGPMRRGLGRRPPFGGFRRRPPIHGRGQGALPNRVHKELRKANHLTEKGDHRNAGVIFERLAMEALDKDMMRHGPMLLLQAAQAYILAEEIDKGVDLAQRGLEYLATNQRWEKVCIIGDRVVGTLSDAGYKTEAENISNWINNALSTADISKDNSEKIRGQLPPKCPYCGATVRSDEVAWINNKSAECVYCGSAVPTK